MEYKKIITDEIKDDKEEYFEMYKIINQQIINIIPRYVEKAKRTPR